MQIDLEIQIGNFELYINTQTPEYSLFLRSHMRGAREYYQYDVKHSGEIVLKEEKESADQSKTL